MFVLSPQSKNIAKIIVFIIRQEQSLQFLQYMNGRLSMSAYDTS